MNFSQTKQWKQILNIMQELYHLLGGRRDRSYGWWGALLRLR